MASHTPLTTTRQFGILDGRPWLVGVGSMSFDQLRRREFMTLLGGAAAAWPIAAQAQQGDRIRRIGVLFSTNTADDSESQARIGAFQQELQQLGWSIGRNARIDYRWPAGSPDALRRFAVGLVALAPDVIFATGSPALGQLQQATGTVPVVFVHVTDPVGSGFIASLAHPGGNMTGFADSEYGMSGKLLELLKQAVPRVTRAAVLRSPDNPADIGAFAAIQSMAPSLGVEVIPIGGRDADEIERAIMAFAHGSNDGLIVASGFLGNLYRDRIIGLAATLNLPAVYAFPYFAAAGGLMAYGSDTIEPYHGAARYIDRILRGEHPGDLPVQFPTKFELAINLKTAKTLGLTIPLGLQAAADELIE
jgi:putative ABC transport system substrate-binding protein